MDGKETNRKHEVKLEGAFRKFRSEMEAILSKFRPHPHHKSLLGYDNYRKRPKPRIPIVENAKEVAPIEPAPPVPSPEKPCAQSSLPPSSVSTLSFRIPWEMIKLAIFIAGVVVLWRFYRW